MNYFNQSLTSIHKQLSDKSVSAEDLTKQTLENIKNVDGDINAFLTLDEDGALKQAKEIDDKGIDSDNLLSGLPIAVKDNIVTKGSKQPLLQKFWKTLPRFMTQRFLKRSRNWEPLPLVRPIWMSLLWVDQLKIQPSK